MHPRICRYFLVSVLLIQSIVILWLLHDIIGNNQETSITTRTIVLPRQQEAEPAHVRPPLTVRDLKVEVVDKEDKKEPEKPSQETHKNVAPSKSTEHKPAPPKKHPKPHHKPNNKDNSIEQLIERINRPSRTLSDFEAAGNNIMITIRTTRKFHQKRLPYMYDTWLNKVNGSNVFLVTDAEDEEYQEKSKKLGVHYQIISCGQDYSRWSLCCKSGEEMALMHKPENQHYDWFCHLDDDIYIILENMVKLFSKFDPKTEPIYTGRAGNHWKKPRSLSKKQTWIKDTSRKFSFAVGGMYCLSRAMLNKVRPWLGDGQTMGDTCNKFYEPEDVTVGATVELLANETLSRTRLFHSHGLVLSKYVNPRTLKNQIGFAYGCGQLCAYRAYKNNAIKVPNARFPFKEDPSRFKSLHCHLYPSLEMCKR